MLNISRTTFAGFADATEQYVIDRTASFLKANVPDLADVSDAELLTNVRYIVGKARSFGFREEADVVRFALCSALLGLEFDHDFPGAREILEMKDSATYRADLLEYYTREIFEALEG